MGFTVAFFLESDHDTLFRNLFNSDKFLFFQKFEGFDKAKRILVISKDILIYYIFILLLNFQDNS